jgi:tetratricopeptide (TPR) repeat protein
MNVGIVVLLLVAGFVYPLAAQQEEWERLDSQAVLLYQQGKYTKSLSVAKEAVRVAEATFGPEHHNVATSLNNLAEIYRHQGNFAEAEPLYKRAVNIDEKTLGPDHTEVAATLTNLAALYNDQGKYAEAEPVYKRVLAIREKACIAPR